MNGGSFPSYNDTVARFREKELDLQAEQFASEYKPEPKRLSVKVTDFNKTLWFIGGPERP